MLNEVIECVLEAGRAIEEVRRSADLQVAEKGDQGPVTEADRRADALLRDGLRRIAPAGWLSEETTDDPARRGERRVWVVDPLDGTKEFVEGVPQYAVAAALVEDGLPILGVVHNPATGDVYAATKGGGAFRNGTRLRVAEGRAILASRSEMKRGEFEPFADWELLAVGSIALKLAMIAAGEAAVTLSRGPKWEWDVCAGSLLVHEAGGRAVDMFGGELSFNQAFPKSRGVLAGAPGALDRVLDRLKTVGASDRMAEMGPPPGR